MMCAKPLIPVNLLKHARTMRREPTFAEKKIWSLLRGKQLGVRFRRQHPVLNYILDFYCDATQLAVELDGDTHADPEAIKYDAKRTQDLKHLGIRVLRVRNDDVLAEVHSVMDEIWRCLHENTPTACFASDSPEGGVFHDTAQSQPSNRGIVLNTPPPGESLAKQAVGVQP